MKNSDENEEENEANNEKDDSQNDDNDSAPPFLEIPPFIMDVVKDIERQVGRGFQFDSVNVRVIGEDDLHILPNEALEQILNKAVEEEQYELAVKVRDAINNKKDGK